MNLKQRKMNCFLSKFLLTICLLQSVFIATVIYINEEKGVVKKIGATNVDNVDWILSESKDTLFIKLDTVIMKRHSLSRW